MPASASQFPHEIANAFDGQFELLRELGRGGMGIVYLARDLKLDRQVAIKVLPPHVASDPEVKERFLREARTAAHLAHPHVVPVHRADEIGGVAFFVMSYVEGESLADRLATRGPFRPADAVRVLREVAWALAYAHARGVVHRDVKPENILIDRATNHVMVGDFGIARQVQASRLTQDGLVLGTVYYMSPEQINGLTLDGRSDLYSLGVVAFHILSGRLPFENATVPAILVAHVTRTPPSLRSVMPDLPRALAAVVDRCLAKEPAARFKDGEELADALEAALGHERSDITLPVGFNNALSEKQATALWKRAAELQADALDRLEAKRSLVPRDGTGGHDPVTSGYRVQDIAAAAEEAGISRQYVAMALAEIPQGSAGVPAGAMSESSDRTARRFLGTDQRSLGVSSVIQASPSRTLRALGGTLQQMPHDLRLREAIGPHPLDGGVLVFDLPELLAKSGPESIATFYWRGTRLQLEARQIQVTLRAFPSDPHRTEVTMTCDLRPGVRRNILASQWIAGSAGTAGAAATAGVVANGLAGILAPAALLSGVIAGGGIVAISLAWYRWLYPRTLEKARQEMRQALEAVARAVHSEEIFGLIPPARQTPLVSDGSADAAIVTML